VARVEKSALVPYSHEKMFALVDDVERYPEFLPWCGGGTVSERTELVTVATILIDYRGIKHAFTTRNTKQGIEVMEIRLVEGPFKNLDGVWHFQALAENACKISLALDYGFASTVLEKAVGPVFGMIATTMIERFVERADALFGPTA
jgi:ribosome-associated toxin RatA of RatAB toxin-antitoxin module